MSLKQGRITIEKVAGMEKQEARLLEYLKDVKGDSLKYFGNHVGMWKKKYEGDEFVTFLSKKLGENGGIVSKKEIYNFKESRLASKLLREIYSFCKFSIKFVSKTSFVIAIKEKVGRMRKNINTLPIEYLPEGFFVNACNKKINLVNVLEQEVA